MTDTLGMSRLSLCGIGLLLASAVMYAQPTGGGPGPVLGIVEIPETFFTDQEGRYAPRAALTLYTRPDAHSKALAVITSPEAIDSAEYAYEELGALVYGHQRGYFRIRTSRGVGWLSPDDGGTFHPLEKLITRELTFLTDAWDGFVNASPGVPARTRVPQRKPYGSENVRVKQLRTVAGRLWAEIDVLSHSICTSDEPPTIKAHGWIRVHDTVGAPTIWFPSRGC